MNLKQMGLGLVLAMGCCGLAFADDPPSTDTDGDGLPDWWEVQYGLNVNSGIGSNLVAWWKFDEANGTAISNSAGTNYNGYMVDMASTSRVPGYIGGALWFDGINDMVVVPQSPSIVTGAPFTVSALAWSDGNSPSDFPTVVADTYLCAAGGNPGFWLGAFPETSAQVGSCSDGIWDQLCCSRPTGDWHHVAMTYDGTNLVVYQGTNKTPPYAWTGFQASTQDVYIGWCTDPTYTYRWKGKVDDVRIYKSALTDDQIEEIYCGDRSVDLDGDGLTNLQEYQNGLNPKNIDSDADGINDGYEVINGLNPSDSSDALDDPDHDGLSNLQEYLHGTHLFTPDEYQYGLLPFSDVDGDGMDDWFEYSHGLDPLNPADASGDPDNDGLSNLQEYLDRTNPNKDELFGGNGPLNTLVVVNGNSPDSIALGAYYAEKHNIPSNLLCTIMTSTQSPSIAMSAYEQQIRAPITNHIATHGLAGQVNYLVLCMDAPTRVDNNKGISSMLYGVSNTVWHPTNEYDNSYYGAEAAYSCSAGWNKTNASISFMLTAGNLDIAKQVVDRAVTSEAAFPEGVFCLHGFNDIRNLRNVSYTNVAHLFKLFGRGEWVDVRTNSWVVPDRTVLGYMWGWAYLPEAFTNMVFAPGAIADHLTSCGGMVPDPCVNQSTVWDWMRLGATASYGTVVEPGAVAAKFPSPMVHFWYARGFTAGEALAMSVASPYQGIWVGDPLAAPFASPPSVRIDSPMTNALLGGTATLEIAVEAHDQGAPPAFLDLYIDGRYISPILRPIAPTGNILVVELGTNRFTYAVARGDGLAAAVSGLAKTINQEGNGVISATNTSDRIIITTLQPLGPDDEPLEFSAETEQGIAQGLYIGAAAGTDRLVVEGGVGAAVATFHYGVDRSFEIECPIDLSALDPGSHVLTVVVRDGSAVQCQSQADLPIMIQDDAELDTDGDGMPDGWEVEHELDPLSGQGGGLAGWWKLDEGSGTNAINSAGAGYSGTLVGFAGDTNGGWTAAGKLGGALRFDGVDDWIRIAQNPNLLTGGAFTISAQVWLDPNCESAWPEVVGDYEASSWNGYCLGFNGEQKAYAMIGATGWVMDTNALAGRWVWTALEFDGTQMRLYLDGVPAASAAASFVSATNGFFAIGNGQDDSYGSERWMGLIDDVRIYRTALGTNGLAAMYDAWDDPDGDGMGNISEFQASTCPTNFDSDGDDLSDGEEVNDYGTDPLDADTDDDGLSDGDEVNLYGANPLVPDTDGDGLSDGNEAHLHGSDPNDTETDRDGMPDGWEVQNGFNPNSGPVARLDWFRFDEGTGVAVRTTCNSFTGVLLNASATNWVRGYTGGTNDYALWFDGANDYVSIPTNWYRGLAVTQGPFSVSAWVRQDAGMNKRLGAVFSDSGWNGTNGYLTGYSLRVDTNYDSACYYVGCSTNFDACFRTAWKASCVGRWVHIVGTYTGTTMKLYVDGVLAQTKSAVFAPQRNPQLWIGRGHVNADCSFWQGAIDDVRFYNCALSTQDVAALYEPYADADSDGLSNLAEFRADTNPRNPDTDGDALGDGEEINSYGTDPLDPDTDGDGMPDGWEVQNGFNPNSGPVARLDWFRFDEGTGVAVRTTCNSFTGVVLNAAATNWVRGHTGGTNDYALWFDGANDYVSIPTNWYRGSVVTQGPFSVSAWVCQDAGMNKRLGAVFSDSGWNSTNGYLTGYSLRVDTNYDSACYYVGCSTNFNACYRTAWKASCVGRWVHIVGTYTGTTMKLYVDGVLAQTKSAVFAPQRNPQLWIGRGHVNADCSFWQGAIDDVRFYNCALSTQDVAALYEPYADADSDGLSNLAEFRADTNPRNPDTDGDALGDGEEINSYGTDPLDPDTDDDGLSDFVELDEHLTDPLVADTDGDGLSDGEEVNEHVTDPLVSDTDGDGLSDGEEINEHETDPLEPDTDGDGLPDGWEVQYAFSPLSGMAVAPTAWWRFDETGGTNVLNFVSTNYAGCMAGMAATSRVSGVSGGALWFDGMNDMVAVPQSPSIVSEPPFTVSALAWLDENATSDCPTVVADTFLCSGGYPGFWLGAMPGTAAQVGNCSGSTWDMLMVQPTGQWHHVAMTYDGTNMCVYQGTNRSSYGWTGFQPSTQAVYIGWCSDPSFSYRWKGKIDNVRIYPVALGYSQITNLYSDTWSDPDGDGQANLQEYLNGTNPRN